MATSLRSLIKDKIHFTTMTFACLAVFLIISLIMPSGFNFSPPANAMFENAPPILPAELPSAGSTLQLRGSVVAHADKRSITEVVFTLSNTADTEPINLANGSLTIAYQDVNHYLANLTWSKQFQGYHNNDNWLDAGELVQITVPLSNRLSTTLGPNTPFDIHITPPHGAVLSLHRITPAKLYQTINLN